MGVSLPRPLRNGTQAGLEPATCNRKSDALSTAPPSQLKLTLCVDLGNIA